MSHRRDWRLSHRAARIEARAVYGFPEEATSVVSGIRLSAPNERRIMAVQCLDEAGDLRRSGHPAAAWARLRLARRLRVAHEIEDEGGLP